MEYKEPEKGPLMINFGGPETILKVDFIKNNMAYLDSTKFKKYNYSFGGVSAYQEKELLIKHISGSICQVLIPTLQ